MRGCCRWHRHVGRYIGSYIAIYIPLATADEVIKFWKVKVKEGQGRWEVGLLY